MTTKNYDKIEDWEAEEGDVPSKIENPVLENYDLYSELLEYLPMLESKVLSRLHKNDKDENDKYIIQEPHGSWETPMNDIMKRLKMKLKKVDGGKSYIEDDDVNYDQVRFKIGVEPGWKITKWRLDFEKGLDEDPDKVTFLDTVTWERNTPDDPASTKSYHKWVPYIKEE